MPKDVCKQPLITGHCRASMPRYYYDEETKTCKHFLYGGCQGNDNNFKTENECKEQCMQKKA